jgi:surfeit locus 1 family protein
MPINPLRSRVSLAMLVLTLLVGAIFIRLGMWQLSRAAEKSAMMEQASTAASASVSDDLADIDTVRDVYRRFRLIGDFVPDRQFLLDNKIRDGRAGFEVLTPFQPDGQQGLVLVNRGWVAAGGSRDELPAVVLSSQRPNVLVSLLTTPSKGFALGSALQDGDEQWPRLLQFVDYQAISASLDAGLLVNAVFVAEAGQPNVLEYNFQPVANGPEKHYAYALQWFAMLLALLVIYIYLTFIKKDD